MSSGNRIDRRSFVRATGVLASVASPLGALAAANAAGAMPRNIVFMVADGMSPSVLPLAEHFSQRARGKGLLWRALIDRPDAARGLMDMASLNSVVTDSSAASSSWGSGVRVMNGVVNVLPDGTALTPIGVIAHERGKRVGLVTTTTVTHATPAGFAAVQTSRASEEDIAAQYLKNADIVLGGGRKFFDPATRKDKKDLAGDFRNAGFGYVNTRADLLAAAAKKPSKLLGLFSQEMVPYSLDRQNNRELAETVPTLAEMTSAALAALESSPKGFLLQIEGGRVDHAAHNNDAAALLWEQLAFDEAIETVLQFAGRHPETLVIITADHGNSNPGLGGKWAQLGRPGNGLSALMGAKQSFAELVPKLGKGKLTQAEIKNLMHDALGCDFLEHEVEAVRLAAAGTKRLSLNTRLDKTVGILGEVHGNHTGVGWVSTDHTSDYVLLTALGPGSGLFNGHIRNTQCFEKMAGLMGSSFRNPSMSAEQASKYLRSAAPSTDDRHWV